MTRSAPSDTLRWSFVAPALSRPAGGLIALFEVAGAIAKRGHDVRLVHMPTNEAHVGSLRDIPWFAFDPAIEHAFLTRLDPDAFPPADIAICTPMMLATVWSSGIESRVADVLFGNASPLGAPMLFVQGLGVFPPEVEDRVLRLPGPKVCVGSQLAASLVRRGVPPAHVVHIANGLDHQTFRVLRTITSRHPVIGMHFDPHPVKGGTEGLTALSHVAAKLGTSAVVFGARPIDVDLPANASFMLRPTQETLARDVYNRASVFLQPSRHEGFGMCAVEAMACGCALVTTDNGGSTDYAIDGETAVVCGPEPDDMAAALEQVLGDDRLRTRIAEAGVIFTRRFSWTSTAERFVELANSYLADRGAFGASAAQGE